MTCNAAGLGIAIWVGSPDWLGNCSMGQAGAARATSFLESPLVGVSSESAKVRHG